MRSLLLGAMFLFVIALPCFAQQPTRECKAYEPAVVRLRGTLKTRVYPGPPNYESVAHGDRAETAVLLVLSEPICVREDPTEPDLNPAVAEVRMVQLVLTKEEHKIVSLRNKPVIAAGTLFGAHTGHHHTPVLLMVRTIEPASEKSHQ